MTPGDPAPPATSALAAVLFDAEGVVVDTEDAWDRGQAEFLGRRGFTYDRERVKPLLTGRSVAEGVEVLRRLYGFAGDAEELARERVAIVADNVRHAELVPGFRRFHRRVRGRYRTALATSMAPELFALLRAELRLDELFPGAIVTLDAVGGRSKPHPDLFLVAAERLAVSPGACAVIEDAPHGIEAARRAGMVTVGLATTYRPERLAAADVVVRGFDEIDLAHLQHLVAVRR